MQSFEFHRAEDALSAIAAGGKSGTRFVAGGTTLLDLMKLNVETPEQVVDINRLPLDKIEPLADGGLKIGATVRNSDLANHSIVQRDYAVLSQAILNGASAQLRNMATTAGNLLQRTRHRHQPFGHVCGDGGIGSDDPCVGPEGFSRYPDRRLSSSAGQHAGA